MRIPGKGPNDAGFDPNLADFGRQLRQRGPSWEGAPGFANAPEHGRMPSRDGMPPSADGMTPPRDGYGHSRDGMAHPRDGLGHSRDGVTHSRDGMDLSRGMYPSHHGRGHPRPGEPSPGEIPSHDPLPLPGRDWGHRARTPIGAPDRDMATLFDHQADDGGLGVSEDADGNLTIRNSRGEVYTVSVRRDGAEARILREDSGQPDAMKGGDRLASSGAGAESSSSRPADGKNAAQSETLLGNSGRDRLTGSEARQLPARGQDALESSLRDPFLLMVVQGRTPWQQRPRWTLRWRRRRLLWLLLRRRSALQRR
jgi:hypothetical protein